MSGSSEVNLKQSLRKMDYPSCAQEALGKVVELICARITSIKNMDLALDLMAEFVFYEVDRRGNRRPNALTPLVELQLLEILYDFLNNFTNETARNTIFLNLFSPTTASLRLGILSKLVSIAVGIPSKIILTSTSTWMQQLGNSSMTSCKLAEALVHDYFHLQQNSTERLKNLPTIAPQFTANFITAVAENYFNKREKIFPPDTLVACITMWISQNPTLCIAAQQRQPVLPPGAIAMEATTPIAGLLRWCILAPIYHRQDAELYSSLHLALLNSIMEIPKATPLKAIYVPHLISAVSPLIYHFRDLKHKQELKLDKILCDKEMQLSLDRLAQTVQVALSVNAVYGHLDDFLNHLQQLPYNKLLSIILTTQKQNKTIIIV